MTTTIHSRKLTHLLAATIAVFALLLSIAPGASAQTRGDGPAVLASTDDCPDGWTLGRHGCQPENLTIEVGVAEFDDGCPDRWVRSSAPGGCSPGYLTLKTVGLDNTKGCPDRWVASSAPGGCSPGFFTTEPHPGIYHAVHTCAFGSACNDMIDAVKALGGSCETDGPDTTCTLPAGPDGRD